MKKLIILLSIVYCQASEAQMPDYYVYMVTGEATITKAGAKPAAVKQNQLVFKSDLIILKKGAQITLGDKNGKFLDLKVAGNYRGIELLKKGTTRSSDGMTVKYAKVLFHELFDPNHDFEKFKKENIAGSWGGVSRGDDWNNRIFPINGLKTSAASIVFKWHRTSPSSDYSFVIYDGDGNELTKMNVKDTLLPVNISETLKGKPGKYFWLVTSEDGTSEDEILIYFEIMTPENEKKQAEQLITERSEGLEMQLQQIDRLEKNAFIDAASVRYAALVKANPGNKALMKSYVAFLLKYGFDEEARAAWK